MCISIYVCIEGSGFWGLGSKLFKGGCIYIYIYLFIYMESIYGTTMAVITADTRSLNHILLWGNLKIQVPMGTLEKMIWCLKCGAILHGDY